MVTYQNILSARVKLERANSAPDAIDPVSGFNVDEIIDWLRKVAEGHDPATGKPIPNAETGVAASARIVVRHYEAH